MTESQYLTAVYAFSPLGPARIILLLSYFGSAKKIWGASVTDLIKTGLKPYLVNNFSTHRKKFDIQKYFERVRQLDIGVVTVFQKGYPSNLKTIDGAPLVLYFKGSLDCLKGNSVSIVGSRKMTSYGGEVTEEFSGNLAKHGVTIVSGLARGVDTVAHKACLSVGGKTAAILGNGLDRIYPPENKNLAEEIVRAKGVLISEYPLGHPPLPANFAIRNRIISGLSDAVVVVEGEKKSGTLLTAKHAAEQGKTLFAVPGQIFSQLSAAPLYLLKNGAMIATSVNDILEELDLQKKVSVTRKKRKTLLSSR